MSASDLRKIMLKEAQPIIEHYIAQAKGEPGPLKKNYGTRSEKKIKEVWDAVIPMIQAASDIQKIRATTTTDILRLLRRGRITLPEAKELMLIMATDFEVTELPKMMERMEELTQSKT